MNYTLRSIPRRLGLSVESRAPTWTCKQCLATQSGSATPSRPIQATQHVEESSYDPTLPQSKRTYPLKKTDALLKRPLSHPIPRQYLQHSTSNALPPAEQEQRAKWAPHKQIVGVVVSAGKMHKTVKVRVPQQVWEKKIGKYFSSSTNHLVHDPNSSLVEGDVVSLHRLRVSTAVRHVVASIVAPFGTPTESRPPIPSPDERLAAYKEKRFARLQRRSLRRKSISQNIEAVTEQELKD